jgi:hypothetical protein
MKMVTRVGYWSSLVAMFAGALFVLNGCGSTAADESSVPDYKDQPLQGTVRGVDFSVASSRARKVPVEGDDDQIVRLFDQQHGDVCSGLSVGDPPPSQGDVAIKIRELPPETGRYEIGGSVEMVFEKRLDDDSWSGFRAIGWVEVEEVTQTTIRGRLAAVEGNQKSHTVTGNFEVERCGCVNC